MMSMSVRQSEGSGKRISLDTEDPPLNHKGSGVFP